MNLLSIFAISLLATNMLPAADKGSGSSKESSSREREMKSSRARASADSDDDGGGFFMDNVVVGGGGSSSISINGMTFSGGNVSIINGRVISDGRALPVLTGSGKAASKTWTLGESQVLTGIRASGSGTLELVSGDSDEITATADDNIIEKLSVSLKGSNLACELESGSMISCRTPILYKVQLRPETLALLSSIATSITTRIKAKLSVEKLSITTSGTEELTLEQDLKVQHALSLQKSGTGAMEFRNIFAQQLRLNHSGTGSVTVAGGKVPSGMFSISGTGTISAAQLAIAQLMLNMSGTGSLSCNVEQAVTGSLSGIASFTNHGAGDSDDLQVSGLARYKRAKKAQVEEVD